MNIKAFLAKGYPHAFFTSDSTIQIIRVSSRHQQVRHRTQTQIEGRSQVLLGPTIFRLFFCIFLQTSRNWWHPHCRRNLSWLLGYRSFLLRGLGNIQRRSRSRHHPRRRRHQGHTSGQELDQTGRRQRKSRSRHHPRRRRHRCRLLS